MPAQAPQTLFINRFFTGLVTQRNPLATPFSYVGINVVQRYDALIDGLNVELTNNHTLARRPAFARYCSTQLGASESPLNFYGFRNISGTVTPILDTNQAVYSFGTSSLTSIFTKGTTAQSFFVSVGNYLYWADGTNLKKWNGTTVTNWGLAAPVTAPSLGFAGGTLSPLTGYIYVYVYRNSSTGHISTASPFSANTGPVTSQQITVSGTNSSDSQCDKVDIYRTLDGGSVFYYVATVSNAPGWSYTDNNPDTSLDTELLAPLALANNPPPTGGTVVCFHMGRIFMAVGNQVYFSAGPDNINGGPSTTSPFESFPPANVIPFNGNVFRMVSTSNGLLIFTADTISAIMGTTTLTFFPVTLMTNFGILTPNAIDQDGDTVFFYTSRSQLFSISPGSSQSEIGFNIGDILLAGFNPVNVYLTMHRSGTDSGVFMSDGSSTVVFYSLNNNCWSTKYQLAGSGGVKCIKSIETAPGVYTLMAGRNSNNGYILGRNLSTFADDNGNAYSAYATIGSTRLSNLGDPLIAVDAIYYERMPAGSDFGISVLLNDIAGTFVTLPQTTRDPADYTAPVGQPGSPSTGVIAWCHSLAGAQQQLPYEVRHMQTKITFSSTDTVKNEVLGFSIAPPMG